MSHYYYTLDISFPFSGICLRGLECTCGSSVKASSFSCELKEFVFEAFLVLSCELETLLVLFKCIVWIGLVTSDGPPAFDPWDHTVLLSSTWKLFVKSSNKFTIQALLGINWWFSNQFTNLHRTNRSIYSPYHTQPLYLLLWCFEAQNGSSRAMMISNVLRPHDSYLWRSLHWLILSHLLRISFNKQ